MDFIKKNLIPLICGLVVLLFIGAYFWPIGSWQTALQGDMSQRALVIGQANNLVQDITIPGVSKPLPRATFEPRLIEAGVKAVEAMDEQSKQITASAAEQNRKGRVLSIDEFARAYPHTSINNGATEIPLLGGLPEPNYLPVMTSQILAVPLRFKSHYSNMFTKWNIQLVGKDILAMPPSQQELQTAFDNEQKAKNQPLQGGMFGATAQSGTVDPAERIKFERNQLAARAGAIRMYVDPMALQRRAWWNGQVAPNEGQIFEALVDSWLQQEVVNAISDVNKGSSNVGTSPIKRLEAIKVGVVPGTQGATSVGPLFLNSGQAGQPPATPAAAGPDFSRTMTGRIGTNDYDVCLMEIVVDLDPAYQNRFLDALYRQNNGYTVLNIKTDVVDPFDAAGNGFLFGNTQVVHLDILMEGVLYRTWTLPIMPDSIRDTLGVPHLPPPGTPAAPAPAPGT